MVEMVEIWSKFSKSCKLFLTKANLKNMSYSWRTETWKLKQVFLLKCKKFVFFKVLLVFFSLLTNNRNFMDLKNRRKFKIYSELGWSGPAK
jgi:hypothetical protein